MTMLFPNSLFSKTDSDFVAPSLERGAYFQKETPHITEIPKYPDVKDAIPTPILNGNPGYIEMYWKCWELGFKHIQKMPQGSPFESSVYWDEGFSPNIYQWDSIFMMFFARYIQPIFPSIQTLDNFYLRQHRNGYICREIVEKTGEDVLFGGIQNTINPPLFSWAELSSYRMTGDKARLKHVLPVLVKYAEWLDTGRVDGKSKHGLYWQNTFGSGMDNTPRKGSGWIDMSCQVEILTRDVSDIYRLLGKADSANIYSRKALVIAGKINQWMWNEKEGLYFDVDTQGNQIRKKTIASFWPMLAGIASDKQAEKLVSHLKNSEEFWRIIPFPSLSADEQEYHSDGGYWCGGVWAPTNYMIIKGLERYGYYDFASQAAEAYLAGMCHVFEETNSIWEFYAPDRFIPGSKVTVERIKTGYAQNAIKDFVGWSGIGPISLLIEDVIGINCDADKNLVTWRLRRLDQNGISNLRVGNNTIRLLCESRRLPSDTAKIEVRCTNPFDLDIVHPYGSKTVHIKAGDSNIAVP